MPPSSSPRKKGRARRIGVTKNSTFNWSALPYDLHVEVYAHMQPEDLMNLARTNKEQHTSLRLEQCAVYWRRARDNVDGLPPCPPWQTEMQYSSFIHDDCCTNCLKTDDNTRTPVWVFYVRYCRECEAAKTTMQSPFDGLPDGEYKELFTEHVDDILPCVYREVVVDGITVDKPVFHLPDVIRFRESIVAAADAARVGIVLEFQATTAERYEHADLCEDWQDMIDDREAERIVQIRTARYNEIRDRVTALGHQREMMNLGIHFQGLSDELRAFVNKPEPLAERDWKRMLPELKHTLEQRRALEDRRSDVEIRLIRLESLDEALEHYRASQPPRDDDVWPRVLDLMGLPDVVNLINLDRYIPIPSRTYDRLVPDYVTAWRKQREDAVLALFPALGDDVEDSVKPPTTYAIVTRSMCQPPARLSLPLSLLWCSVCRELVSGSQAMQHRCCYPVVDDWDTFHPACAPWFNGAYSRIVVEDVDVLNRLFLVHNRGFLPWSPAPLRGCSEVIRSVWDATGLDPSECGSLGEKADAVRLACSSCSVVGKIMVVMGWRRAVHHTFDVHGGEPVRWAKPCSRVTDKVKLIEYTDRDDTARETRLNSRWYCERCLWPHSRVAYRYLDLVKHFQEQHLLLLPGDRRSLSLDSPEYMHPAVLLSETNLHDDEMPLFVDVLDRLHGAGACRLGTMRFPQRAWASMV